MGDEALDIGERPALQPTLNQPAWVRTPGRQIVDRIGVSLWKRAASRPLTTQPPEHRIDECGGPCATRSLCRFHRLGDHRIGRHTIQLAELVCAQPQDIQHVRLEAGQARSGQAPDQMIEAAAQPEHTVDEFLGEPTIARA